MSQQVRKLAVPALTFVFALLLAFVVNPALGLLGFMMAGEPTGGSLPCEIKIFRDEPFFTKVLDDWPQAGAMPRSPKYVFGTDRPITIEVRLTSTKTTVKVRVTNLSLGGGLPNTIDIDCDQFSGGVYRSRITGEDEVLFLADHTEERPNGDLIHVREEDVLQFRLVDPDMPDCVKDVMVDRGEAAGGRVSDNKLNFITSFHNAVAAFLDGAKGYDLDTTFWWEVGRQQGFPNLGTFILNAGADDTNDASKPNHQADILYIGTHGWSAGVMTMMATSGGSNVFAPDSMDAFQKPNTADSGLAANYFINPRSVSGTPTFGNGGKTWGSDIDWAICFGCHLLDDTPMALGSIGANGRFVQDPAPNNTTSAAKRWHSAFGGPRVLHGICGFKSTGREYTLVAVTNEWTRLVKQGVNIPDAWRVAVKRKDPKGVPGILYVPLNWVDTIDTMQRDPAPGTVPSYWSSSMEESTPKPKGIKPGTKKAIQQGRVPATGAVLTDVIPPSGVGGLKEPLSTLLNGQCRVFVALGSHSGTYQRLNLTRAEVAKPGCIFALNSEGMWAFDRATPYSVPDANTSTTSAVVTAVKKALTDNFVTVPTLATQGVFEGEATVGASTTIVKSRYEVVLEQRYKTLTVFDSEIYALLTPSGTVDACDAVFYNLAPTGALQPLISGTQAATAAASDFLSRFPGRACDVTLSLAFYGNAVDQGGGVKEVRPVWAIEFSMGEVVYTLDAVTGAILTVEQ